MDGAGRPKLRIDIVLFVLSLSILFLAWYILSMKSPGKTSTAYTASYNLSYGNLSDAQKLDLYTPANTSGPYPLIIYVHGGGWSIGSKDGCPADYLDYGYAVACIDYRLSGEAKFPAQIHDVKASIRWLRAHSGQYNLHPGRFGIKGDSAGGYLAALAGTSGDVPELEGDVGPLGYSSKLQAVVDYFGPVDFTDVENITDKGAPFYDYHKAATDLIGGPLTDNHDRMMQASPLTYITPDDPPFLIIHGTKDSTVPYNESRKLYSALIDAGVDATYNEVVGGTHGAFPNQQELRAKEREFLDKHLKK